MSFGERIVQRRLQLGLMQKDLADRMGVRAPTVSAYERNTKCPTLGTVQRFADALECDIYDLIDADERPSGEGKTVQSPKKRVTTAMEGLNYSGQEHVADYAEALTEVPRYQKDPASDTDHNPEV